MAPKSKSQVKDEEKTTDLTKDDTLEEYNNSNKEEIVEADYEEISDTNDENNEQ